MAADANPSVDRPFSYHSLASLISDQPDFAIFKRFLASNARNILRLQGELVHLENELDSIIQADRDSGDSEKAEFDFCIAALKGPPHPSLEKGLQWVRAVELGNKLDAYNTALFNFQRLCDLPPANKSALTVLRRVLDSSSSGDRSFPRDLENLIWAQGNEEDLTCLTGRYSKMDAFSQWMERHLLRWYHNSVGERTRDRISLAEAGGQIPVWHYSDSRVAASVNAINTILASLLPTMSIFALYYIRHPLSRMAAIVAFSLLFSVVLTVVAKAKRVDCFAATTAFAAVQVVFVGTTVSSR